MAQSKVKINPEDIEIARLYMADNPKLRRERLGVLLETNGLGLNHHTFSDCSDRVAYINLVLDALGLE